MAAWMPLVEQEGLPGPPNYPPTYDVPVPLPSTPGNPDWIPEEE